MSEPSQIDLLIAGLLSHGFKELSPEEAGVGWRRFQKFGREDRWVRERDLVLVIEASPVIWYNDPSPEHDLLRKCGLTYIRTREKYPVTEKPKPIDPNNLLEEL